VYLDGAPVLTDFEFETVAGPLDVAGGAHTVEVFAAGADPTTDPPALEADLNLPAGAFVSAVAHLDEAGAPTLSAFNVDTGPTVAGFGAVGVFHTAEAPAVDVLLDGAVAVPELVNGELAEADLAPGTYDVTLNAAGTDDQAFPDSGAVELPIGANQETLVYAVGTLGSDFTVLTQTVELPVAAGYALVDIVHGVPETPVDVYANGLLLVEGFEFGEIVEQVLLPAGSYEIGIYAAGADPLADEAVIAATVEVPVAANAAVVAHLDEAGAPTATVFVNDISDVAADEARVTVRHTAEAPAVDVIANGAALVPDLANAEEGVADVPADTYDVALNAAGTDDQAFPATGTVALPLEEGSNTIVYAVGTLGSTFDLVVDTIDGLGPEGAFPDVAASVHRTNITLIALAGITVGNDDGTYAPEDPVTRGQMAAFLRRTLDLPNVTTDFFSDDEDSIFEGDINAVAAYGIARGFGGNFAPDDPVTRGQMAAFLNRTFDLPAGGTTPFTDIATSEFADDIAAIYDAGVTVGTGPTTFSPDDPVTRGQMASFIARALGLGT
jgi:hypothetical protein